MFYKILLKEKSNLNKTLKKTKSPYLIFLNQAKTALIQENKKNTIKIMKRLWIQTKEEKNLNFSKTRWERLTIKIQI